MTSEGTTVISEQELAEIEKLMLRHEEFKCWCMAGKVIVPDLITEARRLRSELKFYAMEENWAKAEGDEMFDQFICHDLGQRAREALNEKWTSRP